MAGFRLEPFRPPLQHVKGLLPPTLTSFPGLAEIQYYLKVTVNRREFYKENVRCVSHQHRDSDAGFSVVVCNCTSRTTETASVAEPC